MITSKQLGDMLFEVFNEREWGSIDPHDFIAPDYDMVSALDEVVTRLEAQDDARKDDRKMEITIDFDVPGTREEVGPHVAALIAEVEARFGVSGITYHLYGGENRETRAALREFVDKTLRDGVKVTPLWIVTIADRFDVVPETVEAAVKRAREKIAEAK